MILTVLDFKRTCVSEEGDLADSVEMPFEADFDSMVLNIHSRMQFSGIMFAQLGLNFEHKYKYSNWSEFTLWAFAKIKTPEIPNQYRNQPQK